MVDEVGTGYLLLLADHVVDGILPELCCIADGVHDHKVGFQIRWADLLQHGRLQHLSNLLRVALCPARQHLPCACVRVRVCVCAKV